MRRDDLRGNAAHTCCKRHSARSTILLRYVLQLAHWVALGLNPLKIAGEATVEEGPGEHGMRA